MNHSPNVLTRLSLLGPLQNLRWRLLIWLGVMVSVAFLVIDLNIYAFIYLTEQEIWQTRQQEAANNGREIISTFIENVRQVIDLISLWDPEDLQDRPELLQDWLQRTPALFEIIRLDARGNVLASAARDDPVLANLFTISQSEWFLEAAEGQFYLGRVQLSATNDPYLIIAAPALEGGVVAGRLSMAVLWDVVSKVQFGQTGQAYLIDPKGRIIAHTNPDVVLNSTSIAERPELTKLLESPNFEWRGVFTNFEGVSVVGTTSLVGETGWVMITELTQAEAFKTSRRAFLLFGGGLLVFGASVILAAARYLGRVIFQPLEQFQVGVEFVGQRDLSYRLDLPQKDEIGRIAGAFNRMADELQALYESLEQQVADRTRRLETIVEVSRQLSGILSLDDLLRQVVTITKETFNYYYVHVYLLDDQSQHLVMAEGYGEVGAELKRRTHRIPLSADRSLVARAVREQQVILVENVRDDPGWLPNPLLPDTQAEMAVPIMIGRELVGVLDVQADRVGGLTLEDRATLRTLANEIAVAVLNTRAFTQTQEALYAAQRLQRLYMAQAWEKFTRTRSAAAYEFRAPGLPPLSEVTTPEAITALQQGQTVKSPPFGGEVPLSSALAAPLKLRGQIIGVLGLHDQNPERRWTEDEIALLEAVGEQMSLAIENARLFDETSRRAGREQLIADMTRQVWASGDLEQVMQTAVVQLGETFNASKVVLRLGTADELMKRET